MKKAIMIGFGILIVLVLAGSASAKLFYAKPPYPECAYCHTGAGTAINDKGIYFNNTHKLEMALEYRLYLQAVLNAIRA